MDGISIVKTLRAANVWVLLIYLTAVGGVHDQVEGLESGGDDYLINPFAFPELLARIRARCCCNMCGAYVLIPAPASLKVTAGGCAPSWTGHRRGNLFIGSATPGT